jgi:hypothetical protein
VRVPGTDIERDASGRWFRPDKNGVTEEFIPSRNSAAGKIERAVKGGTPTPPKPVVVEPTPPIVPDPVVIEPTPPITPQPPIEPKPKELFNFDSLVKQDFDSVGKVPAFQISEDGGVLLRDVYYNESAVIRTVEGKWYRVSKETGRYEEFVPSQNSAAGQLERHLTRHKFKVGEEFKPSDVVTPPRPTRQPPQPKAPEPIVVQPTAPAHPELKVDIDDLLADAKRMPRVGKRHIGSYDNWIGNDETEDVRVAMDAFNEIGRRIEAAIDKEINVRAAPLKASIKQAQERRGAIQNELTDIHSQQSRLLKEAMEAALSDIKSKLTSFKAGLHLDEFIFEDVHRYYAEVQFRDVEKLLRAIIEEGDTEAGNLLARGFLNIGNHTDSWDEVMKTVENMLTKARPKSIFNSALESFEDIPAVSERLARIEKLEAAQNVLQQEKHDALKVLLSAQSELTDVSAQVVKDVLTATRPNFGNSTNLIKDYFSDIKLPSGVKKKAMDDAMEQVRSQLPAEWVDETFARTRGNGWSMKFGRRGHNSLHRRHIEMSGDKILDGTGRRGWRSTLTHEFQHSVQIVPGIADSEYAIFNRLAKVRGITKGMKPQRYMQGEYAFDLGVEDLYTGKMYDGGYTEVTTRGMERLFHEPWLVIDRADEALVMYRRWLLGILAAL